MAYKNIEDRKAYHRKWYEKNKERRYKTILLSSKKRRRRSEEKLIEYLNNNPCADCGEKNILVLEFDHLRNKYKSIGVLMSNYTSWETIEKEIQKCDVVCSNCHRIRTAERSKNYRWVSLTGKATDL